MFKRSLDHSKGLAGFIMEESARESTMSLHLLVDEVDEVKYM